MDKAPMHTPPPWEDRPGTTTGRIVIAPTQPKVRVMVASCGGPNRDANARLIRAAPELLAACQAVAASALRNEAYDLCVAAIAKATKP